jgi:hypothetical protein
MPAFLVTAPHTLGQEAAIQRLHGIMDKVQQDYPNQVSELKETWAGNVMSFAFKTYGFHISGTLTVEEHEVRLNGDLPFAAVMFKGRIEQSIRDELVRVLN